MLPGRTAWIASIALLKMIGDANVHSPMETGGVLMGYWRVREPVVKKVTTSGPRSVRTQTGYIFDDVHDRKEIARIYEESGRIYTYLGDWHTHPLGSGHLSGIDVNAMRTISEDENARCDRVLSIILAPHYEWKANAWVYDRGGKIVSIPVVTF